ncbi:hypothetical protein E4T43_07995 [Aureobasidium subglaciale]|nr:hypothetical protein E4T43_07995 [Aureobasidium subglaciale]
MVDVTSVAYNVASFICALFVLEYGADRFIDHTAIVADRTGVPEAVIALLTAGAEWEELVVVVVCILRHRSSLAVGNIVGSGISNILGAFSLGLVFHNQDEVIAFDSSAKAYTVVLILVTCVFAGMSFAGSAALTRTFGIVMTVVFALYMVSVVCLILKGRLTAPESDSDSDSDNDSEDRVDVESVRSSVVGADAETPLLATQRTSGLRHKHGITYHVSFLLLGLLTIVLSGFVLSTAASSIADQSGISDVVFGVVVLSIATTLPEKFIAVVSGRRKRTGILVANTVGSNIFLLGLCMGILWVSTSGTFDKGTVSVIEMGVLLGSTLFMTLIVWFGTRWSRLAGMIMLVGYVAFLVLEFTVIHHGFSS